MSTKYSEVNCFATATPLEMFALRPINLTLVIASSASGISTTTLEASKTLSEFKNWCKCFGMSRSSTTTSLSKLTKRDLIALRASTTPSLGPEIMIELTLVEPSGQVTSTSSPKVNFEISDAAKGLTFSETGTLTFKLFVFSLTISIILALASEQPWMSPSMVTVRDLPKSSSSSVNKVSSSSPVSDSLAISILTEVDSIIGFRVLPPEPMTVDLNLDGIWKVILVGFVNCLISSFFAVATLSIGPFNKKVLFLVAPE